MGDQDVLIRLTNVSYASLGVGTVVVKPPIIWWIPEGKTEQDAGVVRIPAATMLKMQQSKAGAKKAVLLIQTIDETKYTFKFGANVQDRDNLLDVRCRSL
jgi:hypothetical protein